jgi:hypothetical protein
MEVPTLGQVGNQKGHFCMALQMDLRSCRLSLSKAHLAPQTGLPPSLVLQEASLWTILKRGLQIWVDLLFRALFPPAQVRPLNSWNTSPKNWQCVFSFWFWSVYCYWAKYWRGDVQFKCVLSLLLCWLILLHNRGSKLFILSVPTGPLNQDQSLRQLISASGMSF